MIVRLALSDFRNHADAVIEPGPGFVALTGENGAGKTNVLEAVSLLAPGRGLRRATFPAMARQGGSGGFGVASTLIGDATLGTGIEPRAPERRLVRVNGAAAPATALAEWLAVLWLTPAMDRLFAEGAGERRRFLDRLTLALEAGHAGQATRYETAMRERNRLLTAEVPADPQWLSALEARMAEHGTALAAARQRTVAALSAILETADEGPFARPVLAMEGWTGSGEALQRDLAQGRARDAAAGRALAGPHRADVVVTHAAKRQPAALCSTGEQKALLLSIVMAHADLVAATMPHPPVLLLDEVAAHLDPRRRAALFERLGGKGQVWMTGTEAALFAELPADATRLHVDHGHIAAP